MKNSQMYFIVGQIYFALSIMSQDIGSKIFLFIAGIFFSLFTFLFMMMENKIGK